MQFLIVCGIIYFLFFREKKNARCPYCGAAYHLKEEGAWNCSKCNKTFGFYNSRVVRAEDIPRVRPKNPDGSYNVICPHCKQLNSIGHEGLWTCFNCKKDFVFNNYETTESEEYKREPAATATDEINVRCPYCGSSIYIDGDGDWNCPNCKKTFVCRDSRTCKREEVCPGGFSEIVSVLAKLAAADGRVSDGELKYMEELYDSINFTYSQKADARRIFDRQKNYVYDYERPLRGILEYCRGSKERSGLLTDALEMMLEIATRDGRMSPDQERIILRAVSIFNISSTSYSELKARYVEDLDKYYAVLGCTSSSTNDEIKSSFKKLMLKYHPDRYVSKDLPQEFMDLASEKSRQILEAYDRIKKSRNIA